MSDAQKLPHEPIGVNQVPKDTNGAALINLYVYLPTPRKYILFIGKGEAITSSRVAALDKHIIPTLFVRTGELDAVMNGKPLPEALSHKVKEFEILGQATNKVLDDIYSKLLGNSDSPPKEALQKLEAVANEIIDVVAPDVRNIKSRLLENMQYVWVMNDAAALTSLAVLFSTANGIDSRKGLRELVDACLVMDLPLSKLGKEMSEQIIIAPQLITPEVRKEYQQHPLLAYQLAKKTLRHYSESTFELILSHHELHNSQGFPRQVRGGTLFPLARVLSAAVETFERLKRASMTTTTTAPNKDFLLSILGEMHEDKVEPHLRRHNHEILEKVEIFLKSRTTRTFS